MRSDLRLRDNPALAAAIEAGRPVVPVYLWAPGEEKEWAPGAASRWWLHHALGDLDAGLRDAGLRLVLRRPGGGSLGELIGIAREANAVAVLWNRRCEPAALRRDSGIFNALRAEGLGAESFNASLLHEPAEVSNQSGKPFQVFTPFWRHCRAKAPAAPVPVTLEAARAPARWPKSLELEDLGLLPASGWDAGLRAAWKPTRAAAVARLEDFVRDGARDYPERRDRPDLEATSRLSPYLHFGQLGPRETLAALTRHENFGPEVENGILRQLYWREFAHHLLHHFPHTPLAPLRGEFALFPWRRDPIVLEQWRRGRTGYPIVDAGMRQLWETGWMHNRVRMITASFLVKHLLHDWVDGARWFWDTLVDADLANNTLGWQWTAGCGADAAPYFRVFNPVLQGRKFDPDGAYVKRFVPDLAGLGPEHLHAPWEAGASELLRAGVRLGSTYPEPIVDHAAARAQALAAFETLKAMR